MSVRVVEAPPTTGGNDLYVGNRAPLLPSPLVKLPSGSVRPEGWLRRRSGTRGRGLHRPPPEISHLLQVRGQCVGQPEGRGPARLGGAALLAQGLRATSATSSTTSGSSTRRSAGSRPCSRSQQARRLLRRRANLADADGNAPRPLAQHGHALRRSSRTTRPPATSASSTFMTQLLPLADRRCPWRRLPARQLAEVARRRQPRQHLLALQPHRRGVAARPGPRQPRAHGRLGRRHPDLARRQHLAVLPRAGASTTSRPATRATCEATERNYDTVMGLYGQVPGRHVRRRRELRARATPTRGRATETCAIVEFMHSARDAAPDHRRPRSGPTACEEVAFNSLPAAHDRPTSRACTT